MNRCVSRPGSSRSSRLPAHFGLQQATNQRLHAAARSATERSALPQRQKLFRVKARDVSSVLNFLYFQTQLVKLIVNRSAEHLCLPFTRCRGPLCSGASSGRVFRSQPTATSRHKLSGAVLAAAKRAMRSRAMALGVRDAAACAEQAARPAVFVLALGRTGSSHLLRLLNAIEGYRVSGETDNAWVYMGRFLKSHKRWGSEAGSSEQLIMCDMRRLMLQLHDPSGSARVFGFKEIYSPFVRRPDALPELIEHGVSSLRMLFPRAKFIFHWRENVSRISSSDFWRGEQHVVGHFQRVIGLYRTYAEQHADHAFCTTIEGIGSKKRSAQLKALFDFLGEELTPQLRRVAANRLPLHDWSVGLQVRRFRNGTARSFEFTEAAEEATQQALEAELRAKAAEKQARIEARAEAQKTRAAAAKVRVAAAEALRVVQRKEDAKAIHERAVQRHAERHAERHARFEAKKRSAGGRGRGTSTAKQRGAGGRGSVNMRSGGRGRGSRTAKKRGAGGRGSVNARGQTRRVRVRPDGTVIDTDGKPLGKLQPDGTVIGPDGKIRGHARRVQPQLQNSSR